MRGVHRGAWQHEPKLLACAGFQHRHVFTRITSDGVHAARHPFLLQQRLQLRACGAPHQGPCLYCSAQAVQDPGYVDAAPAGVALHRTAPQLVGGQHLLGAGGNVQRGVGGEGQKRGHGAARGWRQVTGLRRCSGVPKALGSGLPVGVARGALAGPTTTR